MNMGSPTTAGGSLQDPETKHDIEQMQLKI